MHKKVAKVLKKIASSTGTPWPEIRRDYNRTPRPFRHTKLEGYRKGLAVKFVQDGDGVVKKVAK